MEIIPGVKPISSLGIRSNFIHLQKMVERLISVLRLPSLAGLMLLIGMGYSIAQKSGTLKFQYQFPSSGSTSIPRQTTIILRPGDTLNASTIKASLISVSGSFSGKHAGTFTLAGDHKTLIFKPFTLFTYSERLTVKLNRGILTAAGAPVDSLAFYFTIQSHPRGGNIAFNGVQHEAGAGAGDGTLHASIGISLSNAYPNPSITTSSIQVELPRAMTIDLKVFDAFGHEIATLASGPLAEGRHTFTFDGSGQGRGIYHYVLTAEGTMITKQTVLSE